ncbi:MAG: hypothetical protein Tsb0010_15260 [Parvularculaceae bacterium]
MRRPTEILQSTAIPAIGLAAIAYFTYYAIYGQFGYGALLQTRSEIASEREAIASLRAETEALDRRADLLASTHVDPDYLEERLRALAGYARPGDIIVRLEDRAGAPDGR